MPRRLTLVSNNKDAQAIFRHSDSLGLLGCYIFVANAIVDFVKFIQAVSLRDGSLLQRYQALGDQHKVRH